MRGFVGGIVFAVVTATGLLSQAANGTELVTVCDILGDAAKYNSKTVAVLGRVDCDRNLTDTSCFLAEDQCSRPLLTHHHNWPTKIWVQCAYDDEPWPKLSSEKFVIDEPAITEKLELLRRSTKLGFHQEIVISVDDKTPKLANLRDEWGVAFGMIVFQPKLKPGDNCSGDHGCGGWNETPVMIVVRTKSDSFTTFPDDKYQPQHKH
jgi:hypothetical protein